MRRVLVAITGWPSGVTSVLRTMQPPDGIAQVWNLSVFGSKRTMVFGRAPLTEGASRFGG